MGTLGFLLLILALFASLGATAVFILAFKDKSAGYLKVGNYLFLIAAGAITVASLVLVWALAVSDFSIEYVARYTDLSLPFLYKLSAFWGGQAGSLLLWALLVVIFSSVEIFRLKNKEVPYRAATYLACSVTAAFFIFLVAFQQNPFITLDFIPRDGNGMNPMLQNPGMIIHPPTLYIGYVGFTVIIAHAFAALLTKDVSADWIKLTRSWSLIIWVFLTIGIVIGGWWAYVELGWGGYWAWDPVENASLFPWFTATAFIHSAYIYQRRNKMKGWTFALILITFELTILGTFITRSGVIESVHSFGPNAIGSYFLWFILITSAAFIWTMAANRKVLEDKEEFRYLSKEGVFFIANWIFLGITFVTVFGTFLPWITELLSSQKTTVGLEYFNKVTLPFFMAILAASGIAPLIPFGKQEPGAFFKKIVPSAIFMVIVTALVFFLGYRGAAPLALTAFSSFALASAVIAMGSAVKTGGLKTFVSSNRLFGGMIVHLGVVVMAFGVTMSSFYNRHTDEIVPQDSRMTLDGYVFEIGKVHTEKGANYISHYVPIEIYSGDKHISSAYPEMRVYNNHQENTFAEVSYYSMFKGDLYFIFSGFDIEKNQVRIQAIFQPFIAWIWAGCAMMAAGALYGAVNFRRKKENP